MPNFLERLPDAKHKPFLLIESVQDTSLIGHNQDFPARDLNAINRSPRQRRFLAHHKSIHLQQTTTFVIDSTALQLTTNPECDTHSPVPTGFTSMICVQSQSNLQGGNLELQRCRFPSLTT
jgi:hypothetical protein